MIRLEGLAISRLPNNKYYKVTVKTFD